MHEKLRATPNLPVRKRPANRLISARGLIITIATRSRNGKLTHVNADGRPPTTRTSSLPAFVKIVSFFGVARRN